MLRYPDLRRLRRLDRSSAAPDHGLGPGPAEVILVATQLIERPVGYSIDQKDGRSDQGTPRHSAGDIYAGTDVRRNGHDLAELPRDQIRTPGDADVGGRSLDEQLPGGGRPLLVANRPEILSNA